MLTRVLIAAVASSAACIAPVERDFAIAPHDAGGGSPDAAQPNCVCAPGVKDECEEVCSTPVEVSVAWGHACARLESGRVWCWGHKIHEKYVPPRSTPTRVPGLTDAVQLSAGVSHRCALRATGEVACWGRNTYGSLGGPLGPNGSIYTEAAVAVPGISDGVELASGAHYNCVRHSYGKISCWGQNTDAQLGAGPGPNSPEPVMVRTSSVFDAIALGAGHSCGLAGDRVLCWGLDNAGQRGRGGPGVVDFGFAGALEVHAAGHHTCILRDSDLAAECSGVQGYAPTPSDLGGGLSNVRLGWEWSCATEAAGATRCFGRWGNYNVNLAQVDLTPTRVVGGTMSLGNHAGCFIEDGRVWCWGGASGGVLGPSFHPIERPKEVIASGSRAAVASFLHSCSVDDRGTPRCWGDNNHGQQGIGRLAWSGTPTDAISLTGVVEIDSSARVTCTRDAAGAVHCWGQNDVGQSTGPISSAVSTPRRVEGLVATSLGVGWKHVCASTTDGRVQCWGANGHAESGVAGPPSRNVPIEVPGVTGATDVCGGAESSCAVVDGGRVMCWGWNLQGAVNGIPADEIRSPELVDGVNDAVQVECRAWHSCARLQSGAVLCWGRNEVGNLGIGSAGGAHRPTFVRGVNAARELAVGYWVSCVITADRELVCWGQEPGRGRLGTGLNVNEVFDRPTAVPGLEDVVGVTLGRDHGCAILDGGAVHCWGDNTFGQVDGRVMTTTEPVVLEIN